MAATFNIQVKMNSAGAVQGIQQVERGLTAVQRKALQVNRDLRQLFGIYAIKELVTFVYRLADGYTNLQNKLRVVTDGQANLNGITRETFRIAQQTRSSWESTASLYARLALNSKQLGASQQDLLDFTKSLNQAIIISGATSTEAAAGILQLSQGMASGALKGDELRAVLEQLPVVADVISKKLNVTRGQLRQMGKDGKITGDVILKAFKESEKELNEKFGKTIPTLGQSFQMIRNAAMQFFGEAGAGSGVMQSLALALKFVADNMETIGKVVLAVAQAFGSFFIIQKIIALFRTLALVIATHPLLAFMAALGTALLLIRQFGDEIETGAKAILPEWITQLTGVANVSITVGDHLRVMWKYIKELGSAILEFVGEAWSALSSAFSAGLDTTGIEFSLEDVLKLLMSFVFSATAILKRFGDFFVLIFGGLPIFIVNKFDEAFAGLIDSVVEALNKVLGLANYVASTGKGIAAAARGNTPDNRNALSKEAQDIGKKIVELQELQRSIRNTAGNPNAPTSADAEITRLLAEQAKIKAKRDAMDKEINDVLAPAIPKVEYDRQFVKGAADAFVQSWDGLITDIKGEVIGKLEQYDKDVAAQALDRASRDSRGTVGTTKGQFSKTPDPNAGKAHDKLMRQLDALLRKSNEVREAEMKLAAAEKLLANPQILAELEKRGLTAGTVLSDYREELSTALDPLGAWKDENLKAMAAMAGSNEEYERASAALQVVESLTEKGLELKQHEINSIERLIKIQQDRQRVWEMEKRLLEDLNGPLRTYRDTMAAIANLKVPEWQKENLRRKAQAEYTSGNDDEYNAFQSKKFEQAYGDLSKNEQDIIAGSIEGLKQIQITAGQVREATAAVFTETFGAVENFILNAANTGKLAWQDMINTILQALDRLALKLLEQWAMMKIMGLISGAPASPLAGTPLGGTIMDPTAWGGAYASGGSYVVPGQGAPDSRNVMFRLSPGEQVDFTPPGKRPMNASSNNSAPRPQVIVQNHFDKRQLLNVMSTREGAQTIVNIIRENAGTIRSVIDKG